MPIFSGLLNLRGLDIPHNPVFFSYVIIKETEVLLYVLDASRITPKIRTHFEEEGVADEIKVYEYELAFGGFSEIVSVSVIQYWSQVSIFATTLTNPKRMFVII